jgi:DMSO/TMAO reductase YedYZ molybdopterin-dependent catalytic subunit
MQPAWEDSEVMKSALFPARSSPAESIKPKPALLYPGQAGVAAALVMLAVQMVWRLHWSANGVVQAFPELVVAAVSRLTPLSVFGAATENYGGNAKKALFITVLVGIVAVGYRAGDAAAWFSAKLGRGLVGRTAAGLVVAAILWLFTMVVIVPIAHLGFFASKSSYTSDLRTQLTVTFAIFGVAWALFTWPWETEMSKLINGDKPVTRRSILGQGVYAGGFLGGLLITGGETWRLFTPPSTGGAPAVNGAPDLVEQIVATQRAVQGNPLPPTPTPAPTETPKTSASLALDSTPEASPESLIQLFADLDQKKQITPVLTEIKDFYHVSKNLSDPTVSADGWSLKIHGAVTKELNLSLADLQARATTKKITTLCCISNTIGGDLISTAEWKGVPLKDLLAEAGVQPGSVDLKLHAADDYEDSIPVEKGMDPNVMVVVGMNGEALPDYHGFPARLIVPNIYGMKNVKWLNSIEVVNYQFKGYWQTRGWSYSAVTQIWGRFDEPESGSKVDQGPVTATGLAVAGDRGISRVEISADDGKTWTDAMLEPPLNAPLTWVRWAFPFNPPSGKYNLIMRATDGTGAVMDHVDRDPLPDGATGYPNRRFQVKGS